MLRYFTHVRREFGYIRWLSVRRTVAMTTLVIIATLIAGFLLGAADSGYTKLLEHIIV